MLEFEKHKKYELLEAENWLKVGCTNLIYLFFLPIFISVHFFSFHRILTDVQLTFLTYFRVFSSYIIMKTISNVRMCLNRNLFLS